MANAIDATNVRAVKLTDGLWHAVANASFEVTNTFVNGSTAGFSFTEAKGSDSGAAGHLISGPLTAVVAVRGVEL